jgi:hypothetical protein
MSSRHVKFTKKSVCGEEKQSKIIIHSLAYCQGQFYVLCLSRVLTTFFVLLSPSFSGEEAERKRLCGGLLPSVHVGNEAVKCLATKIWI